MPRHDDTEIEIPSKAPAASIETIGQIESPPSSDTAQNIGVSKTNMDVLKRAITNVTASEISTERRNFRPITAKATLGTQIRVPGVILASIFTKIMNGDLPGRFVYRDEHCAAFLTIAPLTPGHTLVVPKAEVDHWIDLDEELASHLMTVAQRVGRALDAVLEPARVALIIAGLEVAHAHLHVVAIESERDLDFRSVDTSPDPADLDDIAQRLATEIAG